VHQHCLGPPPKRSNLQPLRLPPPESLDVAALHATLPINPDSCKTRGPSASVEVPKLELINASEDGGERLKPLTIPSLQSQSPDADTLHVTPPLNPAPCTTRDPSEDMEATTPDLTSDMPAGEELLQRLLLQYGNWERAEGWGPEKHHSAVSHIATIGIDFRRRAHRTTPPEKRALEATEPRQFEVIEVID